jgi:UDP-N-acetylmuramate dehydrogenase
VVTTVPWLGALAAALGGRAALSKPLGPLTTYGVGGPAALYVEVETDADLDELRGAMRDVASGGGAGQIPLFVIGRGSNLLVSDAGFEGVVVHLGSGFAGLGLPAPGGEDGGPLVQAGAALALPVLARRAADAGWSGLSWAVGVPGSVGGAVRMNAGGHGSDMASCLERYRWVDLLSEAGGTGEVADLAYGYRTSSVTPTQLVVEATIRVTPGSVEAEQEAVAAIVRWRREHQPGGSNAGSVFTNPEDDSAGRLIESAGLKGMRLGTARVSEKHANFIQADKGGSADDVRALMEHVRRVVAERCGVTLRTEVRLLGFDEGETGPVHPTAEQQVSGGSGSGSDSGSGSGSGSGALSGGLP